MVAGFQMVDHHIEKIYLENPGVKATSEDMSLEYFADCRCTENDGGWAGEIALAFRRNVRTHGDVKTVYEIVITGRFTAGKDESIKTGNDFVHRLKINGAASLVPIARAVLTATAAMTGRSELYSLPNINIFELKWRDEETNGDET